MNKYHYNERNTLECFLSNTTLSGEMSMVRWVMIYSPFEALNDLFEVKKFQGLFLHHII